MNLKRVLAANIALVLAGCSSVADTFGTKESTHISDSVYLLEYAAAQRFHESATHLHTSFVDYCSGKIDKQTVQSDWANTFDKWMFLQGQERGPIKALEQNWNIQFWPDKKNTTGRKMMGLLAQAQPVTVEQISQQSVAVQGIGALEWLLYDSNSPLENTENAGDSACQVAQTIAQNLANNSGIIAQAWQDNPWQELDESVWISEYISLLSNQLAYAESKLVRPLANIGAPRPYFAEAWRSGMSLHNLKQNVLALQQLYHAQPQGLDQLLRARGFGELADRMDNQFDSLLANWPERNDMFDFLQTKEGYRESLALKNKLEQLNYTLNQEVAVALGVVIGFNSTDGD